MKTLKQQAQQELPTAEQALAQSEKRLAQLEARAASAKTTGALTHRLLRTIRETYDLQVRHVAVLKQEIAGDA